MRYGIKRTFVLTTALLLSLGLFSQAPAKVQKKVRLLFVFDCSNSMKTMMKGKSRMDYAKSMFFSLIDSLSKNKNYEFALRMYGHTVKYPPGDCNDSKLVIPFGPNNVSQIKERVKAAKPTGITPIEHSLTMSAGDFPDTKTHNMIILITDGIEECGGDPCAAREALAEKKVAIKPFIVGIGLSKEEIETFNCVGQVVDAENPDLDGEIVGHLTRETKNKTTAQINLLDQSSNPTETDVNMSIFNQKSGKMLFNYVHAMNEKGNPDTITSFVDGLTYRIVVHTIPPVEKKDVTISAGKHTIIPIDAPQGHLEMKWATPKIYQTKTDPKVRAIVRKSGDMNTLHVQNMSTKEKYLVGTYDLEVLTLPRTLIKDVKVNQSMIKNVVIDLPGTVTIALPEPGDGQILKEENGKLTLVVSMDKNKMEQVYKLQPGTYRVEFRSKSQKQTIFSIEKKLVVESEKDYRIELY